jgi:hypothetical protein
MSAIEPEADEVDGSRSWHLSAKLGLLSGKPEQGAIRHRLPRSASIWPSAFFGFTGSMLRAMSSPARRAQVLPFFSKLEPCLKPYVKRGKTDAADAEAICEAVQRRTMRFVVVKSREQQAALSIHLTREPLVRQRTQLINMMRGLIAQFGVDIPVGPERIAVGTPDRRW